MARFQILALSGGGFLGLYTAAVLAAVEEEIGGVLADHFDLLAGTSIGGIIALAIANRTPATDIRDAFIEYGPKIFSSDPPQKTLLARSLGLACSATRARYQSENLRRVVVKIVGADRKIGDLEHRVMIPAVNLTKGGPQIFKTPHHSSFVRDRRLDVADVALATSAAPTFFPLHAIGGELFADGGLYANAPDQLALHEAEHFLGCAQHEAAVLSIGTTTSKFSFSNSEDTNMGWVGWMKDQRLPNVMISSQQQLTDFMMKHRLADRYVRIDRDQSREQERSLSLDSASAGAISDLVGLAEASVRDHLGQGTLADFFAHKAAPATFYHGGSV